MPLFDEEAQSGKAEFIINHYLQRAFFVHVFFNFIKYFFRIFRVMNHSE